ncbi:hypothetical protein H6F86_08390 [Phormidium sp. FACHB-592]|uniref:Uncharacterized protein n=1 Tax=Stenomitos frigidus AS-A4 TaxID=2933935 RepID=A0ABV0KRU2_9CYAN|nr:MULTISPECIES: hypothetical protein [Cyanophyceae]MBD2035309.1 hypothetical protein [Leptolyngbya sp. FACHB-321]MBD2073906.1 hypothetical protein [Phormidium sp. FACHB-592]
MSKFGWSYPPGVTSLPWDNEEDDERCAIAQWVDRWLGTTWSFKQHYIYRSRLRSKNGWTYKLTLLWVYSFYLYWHNRKNFNLRLSLLKAGQRCHPDEQEVQLVFAVDTTSDLTLDRFLHLALSASLPPIEEQAAKAEDADTGFFSAPMQSLWQHRHVFERWQGYEK